MLGAPPEGRRSARVASNFWIGLDGDRSELVLRRGNLSRRGAFFEHLGEAGVVGSDHLLSLASEDRAMFVQVPGTVVRMEEKRGMALELNPGDNATAKGVIRLIRHCVDIGLGSPPSVAPAGHRGNSFRETRQTIDQLDGNSVDTIDELFADERTIDVASTLPDFQGQLSQIRVPSLLSLLELDKLSGELTFHSHKSKVTLVIVDGRLIDCEEMHNKVDPSTLMLSLIAWEEGEFEFRGGASHHTPRFERSLTWLVLDAAQAVDKANS